MKTRLGMLGAIWLCAAVAGTGLLLAHDATPGPDAQVLRKWPRQASIEKNSALPTLILFAHPRCPCTRASLGELDRLMTHCQGRVNALVYFLQPSSTGDDWTTSDLWQSASRIPGVQVLGDPDGVEAKRFGVATSGHAVLVDPGGNLLFSGGITSSRGHFGDNDGSDAILSLIGHAPSIHKTPVYGCPLEDPTSRCPTAQGTRLDGNPESASPIR